MNNNLVDKINIKFDEIEKDLAQIHKLSSATKTISSICEIQETKENIITKQKAIIDILDSEIENSENLNLCDSFITRLENTAKSLNLIKI